MQDCYNTKLYSFIVEKLKLRWSPQQISMELKKRYPTKKYMQASHETIYTYLYMLPKGELRKELISYLRQKKRLRKNRKLATDARGKIADMISIHERPKEVEDRIIPGHWEGDLIMGKDHKSAIGTIVERTTRTVILVPLKAKDAPSVRKAFAKELKTLPSQMTVTLTYDRGKEMSEHKLFTKETNMQVYFCDPHSPWQRGTNENTNMLIRDFFPKQTDFSKFTRKEIKHVQKLLNERPEKRLTGQHQKKSLKNYCCVKNLNLPK
jgi:IS30 family transposase